ncbi:hypothetical protein [uncultured Parolsenella sp.]|uniref:cyanophycin synthetase family protein n=1 Tax=uncultured Parolsenella sp. TaxID=2083008 RepID=UPI0027DE8564|nr:hypothetical protein [uncultured Parolsenella sp.]
MAQLIDIRRVAVAPKHFTARVTIANGGPLMTDEDLVGTTHVYNLLPQIVDHACLGDSGETFRDVMGSTEVAHLLEHVTIELMARTGLGGDVSCGRTWEVTGEPRTYDVQLACPDDVLVASALSSAAWILQWAYSGGADPKPDVEAIVSGIRDLVENAELIAEREAARDAEAAESADAPAGDAAEDPEPTAEQGDEPQADPVPEKDEA